MFSVNVAVKVEVHPVIFKGFEVFVCGVPYMSVKFVKEKVLPL
jgi:hypothetical protein